MGKVGRGSGGIPSPGKVSFRNVIVNRGNLKIVTVRYGGIGGLLQSVL